MPSDWDWSPTLFNVLNDIMSYLINNFFKRLMTSWSDLYFKIF